MNKYKKKEVALAFDEALFALEDVALMLDEQEYLMNYTEEHVRAAAKIFMHVVTDKMIELQMSENFNLKDATNMGANLGLQVMKLIKVYADIDMHEIASDEICNIEEEN